MSGSDHVNAGLKLALPGDSGDLSRRIIDIIFDVDNHGLTPAEYQCLPDGEAPPSTVLEVPPSTVHTKACSDFFHIDAAGKACFSADEALRASRRVIELDLVQRVKVALNKTDLVLPQVKVDQETFFCNESVYGKATILMVTGVVSLEKAYHRGCGRAEGRQQHL